MNEEFNGNNFGENPKSENEETALNAETHIDNSVSAQDEYVIGNGFKISDDGNTVQTEEKNTRKRKKKGSRGVIRTIVWVLCILAVSVSLAVGVILCLIDYMGLGASKTVTITIDEGESLESIAQELHENEAVKIPWLFRLYCSTKDYDKEFKTGAHTIKTDMGYSQIVYEFAYTEGYNTETVSITIPELATVDDIAELLAKNNVCTEEQFYDAEENSTFNYSFLKDIPTKQVHYRLEGYLFPDTYEFYVWNSKEGAEFAIDRMLSNFNEKFSDELRVKADKLGYSLHEILSLASIIELECSGYYDEMPKVSAVFYNRLNNWGDHPKTLGSSPTADYPYGNGNYDTNKIEGLPPGPLCSTGINAIEAALNPEKDFDNVYFYFVTDTNFKFYYTRTLDEHNYTISSLQLQGLWGEE